ncbi:MAG TPA: MBL fold metallo-hydrolase, partial [Steroidobacteraceae bacterium]|nr:MBL fold metallo-hydrolase [Steroidobacteraceae bacterium]
MNRREVLGSAIALTVAAVLPAGALAKEKVAATALNDHLLLVSGLGGNVIALRGDEGLLLVDSGAPGATDKLQDELQRFAPGAKVQTLINTHWHAAQTGGNETFGKAGAKIIAHAKAAQRMSVDQYLPAEDRYAKAMPKAALPTEVFY